MPTISFDEGVQTRIESVGDETERTLRSVTGTSETVRRFVDTDLRRLVRTTEDSARSVQRVSDAALPVLRKTGETQARIDTLLDSLMELTTLGKQVMNITAVLLLIAIVSLVFSRFF